MEMDWHLCLTAMTDIVNSYAIEIYRCHNYSVFSFKMQINNGEADIKKYWKIIIQWASFEDNFGMSKGWLHTLEIPEVNLRTKKHGFLKDY